MGQARQILIQKAQQNYPGGDYRRIRYVKQAARIAYEGVILALEAYLPASGLANGSKYPEIDGYRTRLSKHSVDLVALLHQVYGQLYLSAYYHGNPSVRGLTKGLWAAEELTAKLSPVLTEGEHQRNLPT